MSGSDSALELRGMSKDQENITQRRRREREYDSETTFTEELNKMRIEMQSFFQNMTTTLNQIHNKISQEISDTRQEMKEIKSATENLISEYHTIRNEIENMRQQNSSIQEKISQLNSDINTCKSICTTSPVNPPPLTYENITLEVQDRCHRQKNIIIAGVLELNDINTNNRREHDKQQVIKIIKSISENCPMPKTIFRLGKFVPGKNRSLKVCFETQDTASYILRNRKLKDTNIRIYWDQTPAQQKYLQSLKTELAQRQQSGETNLTIKYSNGIPKITKTIPKNAMNH